MSDNLNELENVTPENNEEVVTEETIEEAVESAEEAIENAVEEAEEISEDAVEDISEVAEDEVNDVIEAAENSDETAEVSEDVASETAYEQAYSEEEISEEPEKKKSAAPMIVALIVVFALIIAVVAAMLFGSNAGGNKYNKLGYLPISGNTIGDICEQQGIELTEFLTMYNLPADMPADTTEEAAFYSIPLNTVSQMFGMDLETFKTELQIPTETTVSEPKTFIDKIKNLIKPAKPEPITDTTPWGIVLDELTLGAYVGEDNIEDFKKYYELDESVSAETKYKEVRDAIDKKTLALMEEQKAAQEAAESEANNSEAPAEGENAEAPQADEITEAPAEETTTETDADTDSNTEAAAE